MAQSRLNKVASIFNRVNGLLKSNVMPWKERPLWYDIYKAFPPTRDPTYRSIADTPEDELPQLPSKILYYEDKLRAYYFKELAPLETQVLSSNLRKPVWEIFIEVYRDLEAKGISKNNLIESTCEEMQKKGFLIKSKSKNLILKTNENADITPEILDPKVDPSEIKKDFKVLIDNILVNLENKKNEPQTKT